MAGDDLQSVFNVPITGKRKRNRVSYAEPDVIVDDDDEILNEDDVEIEPEVDLDESDGEYGKKRKAKKQRKPKKQRISKKEEPKPFPFLSLPAELRDYIYELALVDPDGLRITTRTKNYRRTITRCNVSLEMDRDPESGDVHDYIGRRDRGFGYTGRGRNPKPRFAAQDANGPRLASPDTLIPNLLAVNRQIHAEAAAVMYTQPIILDGTTALHHFLVTIGPRNMQLLQDLTVKGWGVNRGTEKAMNHCSLVLLGGAVNLKVLYLDCMIGWFRRNGAQLARQIYRDGHPFFEAYGAANGSRDAGVDVLQLYDGNFDQKGGGSWYHRNAPSVSKAEYEAGFRKELRKLLGCTKKSGEATK